VKKIYSFLLVLCLVVSVASCSNSNKETAKTTTSPSISTLPSDTKPLHTIYAVGDIQDFNEKLGPLAEKLVAEDRSASWWILGDGGYGEGSQVTDSYKEIVKVLDSNVELHAIFGDHDYGTQDPYRFTKANRDIIGAERRIGAQNSFVFSVNDKGLLKQENAPTNQSSESLAWTITGANSICVETGPDPSSDCSKETNDFFNRAVKENFEATSCSIAMWHHPVFGVIKDGGNDQEYSEEFGTPFYKSSVQYGVDIILNADHHEFLATKKIGINGKLHLPEMSSPFTRQFIVGTGGAPLSGDNKTPKLSSDAVDSEIKNEVGVLKIDLFSSSANLYFVTEKGIQYSTKVDC